MGHAGGRRSGLLYNHAGGRETGLHFRPAARRAHASRTVPSVTTRHPTLIPLPDELRTLLAGAGLHDITITPVAFPSRYRDPVRYLHLRLTSVIAAIPSLQQLDDQGREELMAVIGQEMAQPLREHTVGDEIVMPSGVQIAHASR